MAFSILPLTLFLSTHLKICTRTEKKMQSLLVSVTLLPSQVKVFKYGWDKKKKTHQVNTSKLMFKMCWHSWLERWIKHLLYFSICSHLLTLQCSASTTHNCELTWILSECHPAISVDCIVLSTTFQLLSKPWKIFAFVRMRTHNQCPCVIVRANKYASFNVQGVSWTTKACPRSVLMCGQRTVWISA